MSDKDKRPKACVGIMIFKEGKVLLGRRKGSHGSGEYSFTGGHMEFGESFEECAKRETQEEAGIKIKNIKFLCVATYLKYKGRQDMLLGLSAEWEDGKEKVMELEKCDGWGWYSLANLPSPLFYPTKILIDSYKTGKNYYDKE